MHASRVLQQKQCRACDFKMKLKIRSVVGGLGITYITPLKFSLSKNVRLVENFLFKIQHLGLKIVYLILEKI